MTQFCLNAWNFPFFLPLQEEYQWPVHGPGQRGHRVVGLHCRFGGQLPARPATSHQHEEDLHHRRGCRQEEEPVYTGQTPSGEWEAELSCPRDQMNRRPDIENLLLIFKLYQCFLFFYVHSSYTFLFELNDNKASSPVLITLSLQEVD